MKRVIFEIPTRHDSLIDEASLPSPLVLLAPAMVSPCQPADYYETLGVQRAVSDADIKKA